MVRCKQGKPKRLCLLPLQLLADEVGEGLEGGGQLGRLLATRLREIGFAPA